MIKDAADVQRYSSARPRLAYNQFPQQTGTDHYQAAAGQIPAWTPPRLVVRAGRPREVVLADERERKAKEAMS